jgi:hypothetical protein
MPLQSYERAEEHDVRQQRPEAPPFTPLSQDSVQHGEVYLGVLTAFGRGLQPCSQVDQSTEYEQQTLKSAGKRSGENGDSHRDRC